MRDVRNRGMFPTLVHHERTYYITDVLPSFKGKRRLVTIDCEGRSKLFDVSDPLIFDGKVLHFAEEFVEMKWEEYYSYWRNLGTRPDVVEWCGETYIVYSMTKITGDDSLYLTIGSKPTERIMIQLAKDTVITRDHTRLSSKPKWVIEFAKQLSYQTKWD
nr:MAG TPA: hypothetical protein [Caudoviricetes sp.]